MTPQQLHTTIRTVILVDIPSAAFLVACAFIGWPIAITMHWLFFWLGIVAFGSIAVIGIAKLESKTLIPIGRDREYFRLEIERKEQLLLASPSPNDAIDAIFAEEDGISPNSQGSVGTLSGTVPTGRGTNQQKQDDNVVVAQQLRKNPFTSMSEMEKITGIPRGSIGRTHAWKNRQCRNAGS